MPSSTLLTSILGWLHKGYPEGVPPKDFYPLLALMARTLSDEELDEIVETLIAENPEGDIHERDVRQVIEQVTQDPPSPSDVRDVAARLAAAGWPLADPDSPRLGERSPAAAGEFGVAADPSEAAEEDGDASVPTSRSTVQRIADWFDFGYPEGVPSTERVPILALLRRRLSDEEVEKIARRLERDAEGRPVREADAEALISQVTQEEATPGELDRVASRLAARGWPLASDSDLDAD